MEYLWIDFCRDIEQHLLMARQGDDKRINTEAAIDKLRLLTKLIVSSTLTIV